MSVTFMSRVGRSNSDLKASLICASKATWSSGLRLSSTISLVGSPTTARSGWLVEGEIPGMSVSWGPWMNMVSISTSVGGLATGDVFCVKSELKTSHARLFVWKK